MKKPELLIIVGPTSSGKSALAVELARRFGGEVISADSRQVYRGLDIGTGKITKREMKGVPHHLLDIASPKRVYTAHHFAKDARAAIENVAARGKLPILAGGTGFYIDALMGRVSLPDVPPNPALRARLERKNTAELFAMLTRKDPRRARTIEPHNKRRLIRALEIVESLNHVPVREPHGKRGRSYLPHMWEIRSPDIDAIWVGIAPPFPKLEKKIRARLLARIQQGMIAEARRLRKVGLSYKRMEALGLEYRALARHLQNETTKTEMIEMLEHDIRRFAKRQFTYWKRNKNIRWFDPKDTAKIVKIAGKRIRSSRR